MVKKFLKIAGVKNEQEFYNKYPTEEAFFKAHPEAKDLKQYKQGGQQKKLNQLTSYQGDIDNIIPTAQDGIATRADSLRLLQNAIQVADYYNKSGNYQEELPMQRGPNPRLLDLLKNDLAFFRSRNLAGDVAYPTTSGKRAKGKIPESIYHKDVDKNRFYQREGASGVLDTRAPMTLFDRRIAPTSISYFMNRNFSDPMGSDIVTLYGYDPISVTPWDMLKPEQQKERIELYGFTGTPYKNMEEYKKRIGGTPTKKPVKKPVEKPKKSLTSTPKKVGTKTVTSTPTSVGITERKIETPPMKAPKKGQEKTNFSITWADPNENPNALTQKTMYFNTYDEFKKAANEMGVSEFSENKSKSSASAHLGVRSNLDFRSGGKISVANNGNNIGVLAGGLAGGLAGNNNLKTPIKSDLLAKIGTAAGLSVLESTGGVAGAASGLAKSVIGLDNPLDKALKMAGPAGKIIGGIRALKEEKEIRRGAQQERDVSNIAMQAAATRPEPIKRKYARPEDALINPNELFPTYGVGTNVLTAEDGAEVTRGDIGGAPTEIQNMYNPYDLYEDLGYEPLDESDMVKQYRHGGIHKADFGSMLSGFADKFGKTGFGKGYGKFEKAGGFDVAQTLMNTIPGADNAGGQIGGGIGQVIGSIIPIPGAGKALGLVGKGIGSILDRQAAKTRKFQKQTQQNIMNMGLISGAQSLQDINSAYMENGGYVSHNWNPQVIAKWGDIDVSDVHNIFTEGMDTLRTGGRITQNNISPMDQFAFGGQMKTHWGGYGETISQNPYLPASGETIMFRGQSHEESDGKGRTGIGVSYGDTQSDSYTDYAEYGTDAATDKANVEVERNEPAIELPDESGDNSMVVFGNLKIPKEFIPEIGDPNDPFIKKNKNSKFKHFAKKISDEETKLNKIIDKNMKIIDAMDDITPFSQMKFFSAKANIDGANMKLNKYAGYKINAATVQNAINDTAEQMTNYFGREVDADNLAKGKFKMGKPTEDFQARLGKAIPSADKGKRVFKSVKKEDYDYLTDLYEKAKAEKKGPAVSKFQSEFHRIAPDVARAVLEDFPLTAKGKALKTTTSDLASNVDEIFGNRTEEYMNYLNRAPIDPILKMRILQSPSPVTVGDKTTTPKTTKYPITPLKKTSWMDAANQIIPYIRPTDQIPLDPGQLYGEMYALASNRLEPVPAQTFQPLLEQPYDISLQDQLNEVTAASRAAQRMAGRNPEASAMIAASEQAAKSKILAEQFRMNQENRAGVYSRNRQLLNQAQLQNLGILDQQMVRQETAKSRTKEVTQSALNSISDKILKNKLENRTLGVYENLYNFRFTPSGRIINMNPLFKPNIPQLVPIYDKNGNIVGYSKPDGDKPTYNVESSTAMDKPGEFIQSPVDYEDNPPTTAKYGKKLFKNGDITKAFKRF